MAMLTSAVAGLPEPRNNNAEAIARLALDMHKDIVRDVSRRHGENLMIQDQNDTGNTVAGVIGMHKFAYDVWGYGQHGKRHEILRRS